MKAVTLVLGSGGARGLSFIGVLEVLETAQVPVASVVGSSMGAIIGAAFCAGVPLAEIRTAALQWRRRDFGAFSPFAAALSSHKMIQRTVKRLLPASHFENLRTPLRVVCTDLQQGCPVVYECGELIPPVVGSSLAAGFFEPVRHQGRFLVDGGYTAPVPARHAHPWHPLLIVDPSALPNRPVRIPEPGRLSNLNKLSLFWTQALKGMDIVLYQLGQATNQGIAGIRVEPPLGDIKFSDFHRGGEAIEAGRIATRQALPQIMRG